MELGRLVVELVTQTLDSTIRFKFRRRKGVWCFRSHDNMFDIMRPRNMSSAGEA